MTEDLSFDQKYNIPLMATVAAFTAEYAGCGTHEIRFQGTINLEEAQRLIKALEALPGIRNVPDEGPPSRDPLAVSIKDGEVVVHNPDVLDGRGVLILPEGMGWDPAAGAAYSKAVAEEQLREAKAAREKRIREIRGERA